MNYNHLTNLRIWNDKIINAYWGLLIVYIFGQLSVMMLALKYSSNFVVFDYLRYYVGFPDLIITAVILSTRYLIRIIAKHHDWLIVAAGFIISFVTLIFVSPLIHGSQVVLVLPLLVSMFYFNRRKLIATAVGSMIVFLLIFWIDPVRIYYISFYEIVVVICMLLGTTIAGIGIIQRGNDLIGNLEKSMQSQQDLLVKNILMDRISKIDALTDLYNHKTFHEYIERLVEQSEKNSPQLQLALMDIDNFEAVNDTYGHWAGDIVLKEVAGCIKASVTANDFVARYGGEEFAVIFTEKSSSETMNILENIREAIAGLAFNELNGNGITISTGVRPYAKGEGKETLFKLADDALYRAKSEGKNKTVMI